MQRLWHNVDTTGGVLAHQKTFEKEIVRKVLFQKVEIQGSFYLKNGSTTYKLQKKPEIYMEGHN
jgi:hypothetical protein